MTLLMAYENTVEKKIKPKTAFLLSIYLSSKNLKERKMTSQRYFLKIIRDVKNKKKIKIMAQR